MFTVKDLMQRYNITRQGVRRFVDKHIEEINSDGIEHAKLGADGWQFDAEAVKIIDELRGLTQIAIIEHSESETTKELREEIEDLKQILLMTQSKLIRVQENLTENQKLLSESDKKFLAAENQSKENEMSVVRLQADLKIEKSKREIAEEKILEIQSQLEKIKNRGLIDRIFNNF